MNTCTAYRREKDCPRRDVPGKGAGGRIEGESERESVREGEIERERGERGIEGQSERESVKREQRREPRPAEGSRRSASRPGRGSAKARAGLFVAFSGTALSEG